MQTDWNENSILLCGTVAAPPTLSHKNHGTSYDTFPLTVTRLSGQNDTINIVLPHPLTTTYALTTGDLVSVTGEVRSFNNKSGHGSRLVITVYTRTIAPALGEHSNDLALAGVLCKAPTYRTTPLGREICDLMLAVNRKYGRADYLPCIAWGSLAQHCAMLTVGDGIHLSGRLQSRDYTKLEQGTSQTRRAYEVSIMELEYLTGL